MSIKGLGISGGGGGGGSGARVEGEDMGGME